MNKLFVLLAVCLLAVGGVFAAGGQGSGAAGGQSETDKSAMPAEITHGLGVNVSVQAKALPENASGEQGHKVVVNNNGEEIQIKNENGFGLKIGQTELKSELKIEAEENGNGSRLRVNLSNGRNAEIKVMPDTASETALQRLGLKVCVAEEGCTIELKEAGKGNETEAVYEIEKEAQGKFLGLFKTKATVRAEVSAETGEILKIHKPFLTKVKEIEPEDIELPEEPEMPENLTE